ncbi:extracellular solute-binding protein [Streptomyces sp. MnatMP-M17]|uniref:ABC transporter substrate-binding protein n=1 Tax=unclassified Streptomyces TaxID=2593676 RepID=UPI00081DD748|nr:extracellular solute-binding protein [Streptomyces sp. MnatMP-M17]MYZ35209.1 extracellular solute-binding protein [Streptomyces sp. SID4917]SCF73621.1 iron(III) transport system substrate-binding protein [Streptomyces sp. MnatMP-M17]
MALVATACGDGSTSTTAGSAPADVSSSCPDPSGALVTKAKKEGTVVMSGPPTDTVRQQLPKAFEQTYGISLDYIGTSGKDNAARLQSERQAGIYSQDVFLGGADTMANTYHAQNWIAPLTGVLPASELDPKGWRGGTVPFVDADKKILSISKYVSVPIVINTDQVKADEITSWKDLLDPKWKGKIATIDPRSPGGAIYNVGMFQAADGYGDAFVKQLYKDQKPILITDSRQGTDDLAKGKYPIALGLGQLDVDTAADDGLPVKVVMPDLLQTTSGFGFLAVSDKPPHPEAAKVLAQWLACPDGNKAWNNAYGSISARSDVKPPADLPAWQVPQDGVDYFNTNSWEFLTKGVKDATELIKSLIGSN